MLGG
ncbi:hypothetical protein HU200_041409 [Digitaria exilis]|jgi:hypothetical protein